MVPENLLRIERRMDEIVDRFEPRRESTVAGPRTDSRPASSLSSKPGAGGAKFSALLNRMIDRESGRQGVSPDLIRAVVRAESGGNPTAVSPKGALGLMQLMPQTAQTLGVNAANPQENLEGGIRYLRSLAIKYGDLDRTLAAYNAGPGAVDRWRGVPPYPETQQYVHRIKKILKDLARD